MEISDFDRRPAIAALNSQRRSAMRMNTLSNREAELSPSSVSTRGTEDRQEIPGLALLGPLCVTPGQEVFEQISECLKRNVLERKCGTMPQFQAPFLFAQPFNGRDEAVGRLERGK